MIFYMFRVFIIVSVMGNDLLDEWRIKFRNCKCYAWIN